MRKGNDIEFVIVNMNVLQNLLNLLKRTLLFIVNVILSFHCLLCVKKSDPLICVHKLAKPNNHRVIVIFGIYV